MKAVNRITSKINLDTTKPESHSPLAYAYFKVGKKNVKVSYDEILYIEGLGNYVKICLPDTSLVVYEKLMDLEKSLPQHQFVRIHRSYIVSLSKINSYSNDSVEILDKEFSIGNSYRKNFFKILHSGQGPIRL